MVKITIESKSEYPRGKFLGEDTRLLFEIALRTYSLLDEAGADWPERLQLIKGVAERKAAGRLNPKTLTRETNLETTFQIVFLFPPFPFSSPVVHARREEIKLEMSWSEIFRKLEVTIVSPFFLKVTSLKLKQAEVEPFAMAIVEGLHITLGCYRKWFRSLAEETLLELETSLSSVVV